MFLNTFSFKWNYFWPFFPPSLWALAVCALPSSSSFFLLLRGFPALRQRVIYHSMVQVEEPGAKLDLNQSLYFHGSDWKWVWPGGGWDFFITASWAIGPPGLYSEAQEFHFHPCDQNKPITACHLCTGAVLQAPGLRTQPTAKLPWHGGTVSGRVSI